MRIFIIGAGAQARLSHEILSAAGHQSPYVFDRDATTTPPWDCELIHDECQLPELARRCDGFLVCMSGIDRGAQRVQLSRQMEALGLAPASAIHPTAYIAPTAKVGMGLQTYPRALVNEFAAIGDYCILGSNASVDHDSQIGDGVHVMGAAAIAGGVRVGDYCSIGTNATILPDLAIGHNCVVGAGAVVTKSLPDNVVAVGVPARIVRRIA